MRHYFSIVLLCLLTSSLLAQSTGKRNDKAANRKVALLDTLDLSKGEWSMYGVVGEGPEKELKGLENLRTYDKVLIKAFADQLVLERDTAREGIAYYNYTVYLVKDGKIRFTAALNSSAKVLMVLDDVYYIYDFRNWQKIARNMEKIPGLNYEVDNLEKARKLRKELLKRKDVLNFEYDTNWTRFEGKLSFEAKYPNVHYSETLNWDSLEQVRHQALNDKLTASYPKGKDYEIGFYWGSESNDGVYDLERYYFYCDREIAGHFNAFPVVEAWKPLTKIRFTIYGITREELDRMMKGL